MRERARITDLFPQADLRRRGSEFLTLCPWHQDSNASLTVSPRTNRVHCFVCNKGADPIAWLQERQGLSFCEAVEELARRYAIPLPEQDPEAAAKAEAERQERQRLRQWRSRQEEEFHQALISDLGAAGTAARYLEQRGISPETAITWRLGLNAIRLMLPIRDGQGRCCGFSGRSLNGEEPKYRNSSGDLLFQKSQLLFGLDRATEAIRRSGEALLVEGPLDVIQLHQAGLDNAVAALGTAVTLEQLQRLQRSGTKRLWLAYDGDSAGVNATARLIGLARPCCCMAIWICWWFLSRQGRIPIHSSAARASVAYAPALPRAGIGCNGSSIASWLIYTTTQTISRSCSAVSTREPSCWPCCQMEPCAAKPSSGCSRPWGGFPRLWATRPRAARQRNRPQAIPTFSKSSAAPYASSSAIQGCGKCSRCWNSLIPCIGRRWAGCGASSSGWLGGMPAALWLAPIDQAVAGKRFKAMGCEQP